MFILSAGHGIQAISAFLMFPELEALPMPLPAWYLVLSGAFWGAGWLAGGAGLWRMRESARRFLLAWTPLSLAGWLADLFWFERSPELWQSIGFHFGVRLIAGLALTLLLVGFAGRFSPRPDRRPG